MSCSYSIENRVVRSIEGFGGRDCLKLVHTLPLEETAKVHERVEEGYTRGRIALISAEPVSVRKEQ